LLFHALLQVPGGSLAPLSVTFDATGSRDPDPGDTISFSGHATDAEEGSLPPSALRWSLVLHHCTTPSDCHVHPLQDFPAVDGGSFAAPDHEYPSWLKLSLTVTDSGGLSDEASVRLDPKTVNLTFTSTPVTHLRLAVGAVTLPTPFTRTVIVGSANSVSAPTPQTLISSYSFAKWSDGGARSHTLTAPAAPTTYTAVFVKYLPTYWYLRNSNTTGPYETKIKYGAVGDTPVVGDWNGDGVDTVGTFVNGAWYLRNSNTAGPYETKVVFGATGEIPVVGDWDGDGVDTVGTFKDGVWHLRNSNTTGPSELTAQLGRPGDIPVVGDWNGDGLDTIGVFRAGVWYLRMSSLTSPYVTTKSGLAGDVPLAGDWDGHGTDTIGVFRAGTWYLRMGSITGPYRILTYGKAGERPVVGDWNRDGTDTLGTFK
jgi:hypothetical protein